MNYFWDIVTLMWMPRFWRYGCFVGLGVCLGLGLVAVRMSRAASYLSDDPTACINCHIMNDAYLSWAHGSHRQVAICNDCHLPHSNAVAKYAFKGRDGIRHSAIFTMNAQPQVLHLSHGAVPVIQANCIRCHKKQIEMIRLASSNERVCWDCHQNIHGSVRSLSASPREMKPALPSAGLPGFNGRTIMKRK